VTDSDSLRIGTAERETAVKILSDHLSEGRLGLEEYDERMSAALEARTRGDLRVLFRDLPAPYPAFMVPPMQAAPAPLPAVYFPPPPPIQPPMYSERSRVVAGVLQIVFPFGIGRFYTGHTGIGVAQLLTMFIGVGVIWSIIDGIIMLAGGVNDAEGRQLRY
jgi:TM2 domain-containing membrane protein YozV